MSKRRVLSSAVSCRPDSRSRALDVLSLGNQKFLTHLNRRHNAAYSLQLLGRPVAYSIQLLRRQPASVV